MRALPKLLAIEWLDSHGFAGWNRLDELERLGRRTMTCVSVGFLVVETDDVVVLASSLSAWFDPDIAVGAKGDISIPKVAITRRRALRWPIARPR